MNFQQVMDGVAAWNAIAQDLDEANKIFGGVIKFTLGTTTIPMDSGTAPVNFYLGYYNEQLFGVLIHASKDLEERYTSDPTGVFQDMVIVQATNGTGFVTGTTPIGSTTDTLITHSEAQTRIEHWPDPEKRLIAMQVPLPNSSPFFFEIPKVNFEATTGSRFLLFGLKDKKVGTSEKYDFDILVRREIINLTAISDEYLDRARPVPPYSSSSTKGLYDYLNL